MKKSIIALAVAGALTAPMVAQADATLYGSLRLSLNDLDGQEVNMNDNVSRIGIKGSSELFDGNKAIFQFEQAVDTAGGGWGGARLASIGITGDFGTVNAGRQWSPFALWTVLPFHTGENSLSLTTAGYRNGTAAWLHRLSNTVAYVTPNMSGLQLAGVVIMNNPAGTAGGATTVTDVNGNGLVDAGDTIATAAATAAGDGEDLDAYNLAAKYTAGGLMVSGSYVNLETIDQEHTSLGVTYTVDNLKVGARYATTDFNTVGTDDIDQYSLIAKYTMDKTSFMANYVDHEGMADEKQFSLEVQQQLGKQARAYVAYLGQEDADGLEVGYRVDF